MNSRSERGGPPPLGIEFRQCARFRHENSDGDRHDEANKSTRPGDDGDNDVA